MSVEIKCGVTGKKVLLRTKLDREIEETRKLYEQNGFKRKPKK